MIAPCRPSPRSRRSQRSRPRTDWHENFLAMLPAIRRRARLAFRSRSPEAKEDLVEEVVANCFVAFARLVELDKADLAYPTVLADYAVRQVCEGRHVGTRLSARDVLSHYAQQRKGFRVERLDRFDVQDGGWLEAVVPDDRRPVPEQAAFRVDFPAWLASHTRRNRRIAERLAAGYTTGEVARRHRLSPARVSQLRRVLRQSWNAFQQETAGAGG